MKRRFVQFAVFLLLAAQAPLAAQIPPEEYADRRARLAAETGEGIVLVFGAGEPEQDYIPFFQSPPFRYLTGFRETNAVLLLLTEGDGTEELLFVNPRDPATETWEGYRIGPERAEEVVGVPGRSIDELPAVLDSLLADGDSLSVVGDVQPDARILSEQTQRLLHWVGGPDAAEIRNVTSLVDGMREVKTEAEVDLIRRSVEITARAQRDLMRNMRPELYEFEIQALAEYTFRRYGAERPAFASIVGSGPNSTILHYNENERRMEADDLVVIDIGSSYRGYAADITRTLPVDGVFSEPQREIYQLVRDAQDAAEDVASPGEAVDRMSAAANRVLSEGLADLGLIEAPRATYDCEMPNGGMAECPQLFLYYMHALGHGIGLDVHDPWPSALEPGTAFTIEPGVYVRPDLLEIIPDTPRNRTVVEAIRPAFERYREIGVRIEDDYVMTEDGLERLSHVAREVDEVEALMAEEGEGPSPRDPEVVEWFERFSDGP